MLFNRFSTALFFLALFFNALAQNTNNVKPFLPEIISQFPNVRDVAISPSGNEICFSAQSVLGELSTIVYITFTNNKWSKPQIAKFSGRYNDLEPFYSPDGLKLYFASNRPLDKATTETKDYDIWYVSRKDFKSDWSEPVNIGVPVNTKEDEFYPSVTLSGNLYFTSTGHQSKGKDDIFISKYINNVYQVPESLSDSVNSAGYEFNAFVAPDESFIIYTCYNRKDGYGSGDLYMSRKKQNGEWSTAVNMGKEINSSAMDYCPYVNAKSNMLYFTSKRSNINPKLDNQQNIDVFLKEVNQYSNGQSRLYEVNIGEWLKGIQRY